MSWYPSFPKIIPLFTVYGETWEEGEPVFTKFGSSKDALRAIDMGVKLSTKRPDCLTVVSSPSTLMVYKGGISQFHISLVENK